MFCEILHTDFTEMTALRKFRFAASYARSLAHSHCYNAHSRPWQASRRQSTQAQATHDAHCRQSLPPVVGWSPMMRNRPRPDLYPPILRDPGTATLAAAFKTQVEYNLTTCMKMAGF